MTGTTTSTYGSWTGSTSSGLSLPPWSRPLSYSTDCFSSRRIRAYARPGWSDSLILRSVRAATRSSQPNPDLWATVLPVALTVCNKVSATKVLPTSILDQRIFRICIRKRQFCGGRFATHNTEFLIRVSWSAWFCKLQFFQVESLIKVRVHHISSFSFFSSIVSQRGIRIFKKSSKIKIGHNFWLGAKQKFTADLFDACLGTPNIKKINSPFQKIRLRFPKKVGSGFSMNAKFDF